MNKENILWKQNKIIDSITPFTLLDYHNTPSAILWFSGCNMRCSFCYNSEIVFSKGKLSFNDVNDFFISRQNLLKGVVLCGGEPTIHSEVISICKELKSLNYKVKLDTNGLNPNIIKQLIDYSLLDYVALDFKSLENKFQTITKTDKFTQFKKTLQLLIAQNISFEIRTTYHKDLLSYDDLLSMLRFLENENYKGDFFIQKCLTNNNTIDKLKDNSINNFTLNSTGLIKIKYRNF
jgi:pyruvate formate lyase activating enzyme